MLRFNEFQTVGYSQNFEYLGDAINYRKIKRFSLQGRMISDRAEDSGELTSPVYDIWDGMELLRSNVDEFQEIFLNGTSIGSGRVTNYSFPENIDPRQSNYSVDVEIYDTGDTNWLSGHAPYSGWVFDSSILPFIESITENFDFETLADGTYSYRRSLDFTVIEPGHEWDFNIYGDFIQRRASFFGDPGFSGLSSSYPSFYAEQGHRLFSERHDPINGQYSFSETFKSPNSGEDYYWTHNLSLDFSEDGEVNVSEGGTVQGVRRPIKTSAMDGMSEVEASSKARVEEFYNSYATGCADELFLFAGSKTLDEFAGLIEYDFNYTTDPFSNGCFVVKRESSISTDERGLVTISENGSVASLCGDSGPDRLGRAVEHFNDNISGDVFSRIYTSYTGYEGICGCESGNPESGDLRLGETNFSYSDFGGIFEYLYLYKNDCSSLVNNCFYVTKERIVEDTLHNVFLATTINSGEIAQKQNTSSLIRTSENIVINGICTGENDIDSFLAVAIDEITIPSSSTYYMENANYSYNPDESLFTLSVNYMQTGYREYFDLDV